MPSSNSNATINTTESNTINDNQEEILTIEKRGNKLEKDIEKIQGLMSEFELAIIDGADSIELAKINLKTINEKIELSHKSIKTIKSKRNRIDNLNDRLVKLTNKITKMENKHKETGVINTVKLNRIESKVVKMSEVLTNKIEPEINLNIARILKQKGDILSEKSKFDQISIIIDSNLDNKEAKAKEFVQKFLELNVHITSLNNDRLTDKDKKIILKLNDLFDNLKNNLYSIIDRNEKVKDDISFIKDEKIKIEKQIVFINDLCLDGSNCVPKVHLSTTNTLVNCIGTLKATSDNSQSSVLTRISNDFSISTTAIIKH